ncbi:hypothetical protein TNCV_1884091 [Trichonephila clavipes]|nr:hypothetical protein TNCV_1884091 [Trichonephila clavipes]
MNMHQNENYLTPVCEKVANENVGYLNNWILLPIRNQRFPLISCGHETVNLGLRLPSTCCRAVKWKDENPGICCSEGLTNQFQKLLHEYNKYIIDFKTSLDSVPVDQKEFKVVIKADRKSLKERKSHFNTPHLENKLRPESIDKAICDELSNSDYDLDFYEIIRTATIHGPCGYLNKSSPYMFNGNYMKKYPRCFLKENQTGEDGYPKDLRRSDGIITKIKEKVENR